MTKRLAVIVAVLALGCAADPDGSGRCDLTDLGGGLACQTCVIYSAPPARVMTCVGEVGPSGFACLQDGTYTVPSDAPANDCAGRNY